MLLKANRATNGSGDNNRYYMAASPYFTNIGLPVNDKNTTAILEYTDAPPSVGPPDSPALPVINDTAAATAYTVQLRSLVTKEHPIDVPMEVDEHMLVTISVNTLPCGANETCTGPGPGNTRFAASLNNISFMTPTIDILDAYYDSISGVYEPDFPNKPSFFFNFTAPDPPVEFQLTKQGTKVKVVEYGTVVEVVLQDTAILGAESHPMHLHGFSFYVVGRGFGNFDKDKDPTTYNLVDPPYQNTVSVPTAGWAVMRFHATNPGEYLLNLGNSGEYDFFYLTLCCTAVYFVYCLLGVWYMHCHFDSHMEWGMDTVFIVKNGKTPGAQMMPRPPNMPKC
jgi:laccase